MADDVKQPNNKLRYHRERRGWSQHRLADQLGTSEGMVSRWECGERKTSRYYQEQLCTIFDKSAEELGLIEEKQPGISSYHALATYLQYQKTRLLDVLAPGATNLRMKEVVGRNGLFISPPWEIVPGIATSMSLVEYVLDAFSKNQRILLLGEAGQGKTTVLKHLFTLMVERFLHEPSHVLPLPLYIPLRDITLFTGNATELLWAYVREEFPLSFEEFSALIRNDQIVFLFDGFDEITGELTQRSINERAASTLFGHTAILSCRKNFYDFYLSMSPLQERYPQKVELLPLTLTKSVINYIVSFCNRKRDAISPAITTHPEKIVATIQEDLALQDLAQRPLLLMMIVDIFTDPKAKDEVDWNQARLYQKYTDKWLKYETAKPGSALRWNEKAFLMQQIAWSIYRTRIPATSPYGLYQNITFTQQDLVLLLERVTTRYQHIPFIQLIDDICFHTFLVSRDEDTYYFIHKSFQEYYVA